MYHVVFTAFCVPWRDMRQRATSPWTSHKLLCSVHSKDALQGTQHLAWAFATSHVSAQHPNVMNHTPTTLMPNTCSQLRKV